MVPRPCIRVRLRVRSCERASERTYLSVGVSRSALRGVEAEHRAYRMSSGGRRSSAHLAGRWRKWIVEGSEVKRGGDRF